jgi:ubiquinone/menaquinone biosynthesis C-methylase UbiE
MSEKPFSDGEAYERRMGRWSRLVGDAFLDRLAAPNGMHWLDVGCGNGAFTAVLIAPCAPAAVSAIDPSEGRISSRHE